MTDIDRYVHASSNHHPSQNPGILHTLATRAVKILDNEHLEDELGHLSKALQSNGYNKKDIGRAFKRAKDISNKDKNTKKDIGNNDMNTKQEGATKVLLPYIQGMTDKISKVLRKKQISTVFCPPTSLRNILDKEKDPVDPKLRKGIYSIPCSCGEVYIGETSRSIKLRLKEHCVDTIHERTKKSVMAESYELIKLMILSYVTKPLI